MSLIAATLSLIDEDQGVCPDGHQCGLHVGDVFTRVCDTPHPDLDGEPFITRTVLARWGVTEEEVDEAVTQGADANVAYVVRATIREGLW